MINWKMSAPWNNEFASFKPQCRVQTYSWPQSRLGTTEWERWRNRGFDYFSEIEVKN